MMLSYISCIDLAIFLIFRISFISYISYISYCSYFFCMYFHMAGQPRLASRLPPEGSSVVMYYC